MNSQNAVVVVSSSMPPSPPSPPPAMPRNPTANATNGVETFSVSKNVMGRFSHLSYKLLIQNGESSYGFKNGLLHHEESIWVADRFTDVIQLFYSVLSIIKLLPKTIRIAYFSFLLDHVAGVFNYSWTPI